MGILILIIKIIGLTVGLMITLNIINIIQAGDKRPDGRILQQILDVDPEKASFEDVERLSRRDKMQLFYAAKTPDFNSLHGEYQAKLLSGGVLDKASALFTHHVFPIGKVTFNTKWVGKAFSSDNKTSGNGYNIFTKGNTDTLRLRKIRTSMGPSKVGKDHKLSFLIDYSLDNSGTIHSMKDEIRQINDNLFIGAGYMALGGGPINPGPFVLIGPPKQWVGPDDHCAG